MRADSGLPNHWHLFNLRESPYFQDTLGEPASHYPLSLFVGRDAEVRRLLAAIGGASSSRLALGGAPGVGKTTLAQLVKSTAVAHGYWATNGVLPFYPDDTPERVLGGVLEGLYEAVLTARPHSADHAAMRRAQQYVRAFRLAGGGVSLSVLGVGGGGTRSEAAVTPAGALLLDGPRVIRELLDLSADAGARGVVLHLNNLENLSEKGVARAADVLRSLRDPVLMQHGLHTMLVGTVDAVTGAALAHPQLRSVFTLQVIHPMPVTDLQALLAARYRHLVLDPKRGVTNPVTRDAVAALYGVFRGDLRGVLKALDEGVGTLVGLVGPRANSSLAERDLRPALGHRYAAELTSALSPARARQLSAWALKLGTDATPHQERLTRLWRVSQAAVSQTLRDLIRAGYVLPLAREGSAPACYALAGPARLVFG
jgi:hypothetical protein